MSATIHPSIIAHLEAITAVSDDGYLVLSVPMPEATRPGRTAPWASWSFHVSEVDAAVQAAADLDDQGRNVYVRAALLARPLRANGPGWSWKRGLAEDTGAAIALVIDLDVAGAGHEAKVLPMPPDIGTGQRIFSGLGLPKPSLIVSTGGGQHWWWLLDEAEADDPVGLLDCWGERVVYAGVLAGYHVDRPDPARVLRVAGTHRRKPGLEPNLVELIHASGWRYGARDLLECLPAPPPPDPPPPTMRASRSGDIGPADALSLLTWAQILQPLGWTYVGMGSMKTKDKPPTRVEKWLRPGDSTSAYSIKCIPDGPAVAWSDTCGLPVGGGKKLSKFRVFCQLHGLNESEAGRMIRDRSRGLARAR